MMQAMRTASGAPQRDEPTRPSRVVVALGDRASAAAVAPSLVPIDDIVQVKPSEVSFPLVVDPAVDHEVWRLPVAPIPVSTWWLHALGDMAYYAVATLICIVGVAAAIAGLWPLTVLLGVVSLIWLGAVGRTTVREWAHALLQHHTFSVEHLRVDNRGVQHGSDVVPWSELTMSVTELDDCCMVELRGEHAHIMVPMALERDAVDRVLRALADRRRQRQVGMDPLDAVALQAVSAMRARDTA